METSADGFNLHQTLVTIGHAMQSVFSHMLFDFALHGFILFYVCMSQPFIYCLLELK